MSDSWQGGAVCFLGVVSHHALRQTPPVNRMTNSSKNITLATTSLWPVIKGWHTLSGVAPFPAPSLGNPGSAADD